MRFKFEPFAHQKKEFDDHAATPVRMFPWDPGIGKTKSAIDEAATLFLNKEITGALVVAPNGVHRGWAHDEIPRHLTPDVENHRCFFWDHRRHKNLAFRREWEEFMAHEGLAFLFVSYSALMSEVCAKSVKAFLGGRRCLYTLDESQYAKSAGSKRTIRVLASGKYAPYRRALSATPIDDTPFDLYAQIKFLNHDLLLQYGVGDSFSFRSHFGVYEKRRVMAGGEPRIIDQVVGFKNLHILKQMIALLGTRVKKDEVMDLPPKLYSKRYFELTADQSRIYDELLHEYRAWISGDEFVTAELAITRMVRFQQVTSGYVPNDGKGEPIPIPGPNPRLDVFCELLDEIPGKVIVWGKYRQDINKIVELSRAMGYETVRYDGAITEEERAESKRRFIDGSARVFVAQPSVGGIGLDGLQIASYVIFYNTTFAYGRRVQTEDRAHRIGTKGAVNIFDLVGIGTVDEKIIESLRKKHATASEILGDEIRSWI